MIQAPLTGGPIEQQHASRGRHRDAQRILMRGSDVHRARVARAANPFGHDEPFAIHRHRNQSRSTHQQRLPRAGIARLFEPHALIGIEQHLRGKLNTLLRAGGHQNLRRLAAHRAHRSQIFGNRCAQRRVAFRVAVREHLPAGFARVASDQLGPQADRKMFERGQAHAEGDEFVRPGLRGHAQQIHAARNAAQGFGFCNFSGCGVASLAWRRL